MTARHGTLKAAKFNFDRLLDPDFEYYLATAVGPQRLVDRFYRKLRGLG